MELCFHSDFFFPPGDGLQVWTVASREGCASPSCALTLTSLSDNTFPSCCLIVRLNSVRSTSCMHMAGRFPFLFRAFVDLLNVVRKEEGRIGRSRNSADGKSHSARSLRNETKRNGSRSFPGGKVCLALYLLAFATSERVKEKG